MRNLDPENPVKLAIKADPVDLLQIVPIFQCHHQVEPLFDSNAADPKNVRDIDNADAANLHVIPGQCGRGRHQFSSLDRSDACDVVRDEAMAALDQTKNAFAFTDSARA